VAGPVIKSAIVGQVRKRVNLIATLTQIAAKGATAAMPIVDGPVGEARMTVAFAQLTESVANQTVISAMEIAQLATRKAKKAASIVIQMATVQLA